LIRESEWLTIKGVAPADANHWIKVKNPNHLALQAGEGSVLALPHSSRSPLWRWGNDSFMFLSAPYLEYKILDLCDTSSPSTRWGGGMVWADRLFEYGVILVLFSSLLILIVVAML
jgi:hypothetical protein